MSKDFPDLSALKAGDCAAWREAFCHLWPMALRAAQHPEARLATWEAEDVASDAIEELISRFDAVTSVDHAKALVFSIARGRAISLARRKSAAKRRRPDDPDCGETSTTELSDIERIEMAVLLRQALDVLDSETQLLLMEKVVHNFTYEEISARRGLPLGTVCTKVARGLKKVRVELKESPLLMKELREYLR